MVDVRFSAFLFYSKTRDTCPIKNAVHAGRCSGSGSSTRGVNAKTGGRTRGRTDGEVELNKCEMQKIWKRRGERRTERNGQNETDEDEKQSAEVRVPAQMADWSRGTCCHCACRLQEKKNSSSRLAAAARMLHAARDGFRK
ncbi:hypothetical protein KOW79_018586 [Hemibagrus wyckioides]|uniref:Uncharacterized protein n=1 Tax=Hemibagrus wyckioides TaxID=337641 RepID=A0A9D3N7F0_9TELE|nr:hypothetical protein KOW79_018586 [Hemibagrus wyckioides]